MRDENSVEDQNESDSIDSNFCELSGSSESQTEEEIKPLVSLNQASPAIMSHIIIDDDDVALRFVFPFYTRTFLSIRPSSLLRPHIARQAQ